MNAPDRILISAEVRLSAEEQSRLVKLVSGTLGVGKLDARGRRAVLENIASGLRRSLKPHAETWASAFLQLADTADAIWPLDAGTHPELTQVILRQPAQSRSALAKRRCLTVASHAALALHFQTTPLYADFADNLGKLFRREDPHWTALSELDCTDLDSLGESVADEGAPAALGKFKVDLVRLIRTALPDPEVVLLNVPARDEPEAAPDAKHATEEVSEQDSAGTVEEPKKNRAGKKELTSKPNFALLEAQCNAGIQADNADGYRLPLHWNKLSSAELRQALQPLNAALMAVPANDSAWRNIAHAAGRYLSLFAGLSLRQCWSLPLGRRGSMHFDPQKGLFRRDLLKIAPRTDQPGRRRCMGRWWRTKVAPEIARAMRLLCDRHPGCRTLGELLEAAGLTYTDCQKLFSAGWHSSHWPEDARFAFSLRPCLLDLGFHPALVARVSGDVNTVPPSDFYYLSFSEGSVHLVEYSFWRWAGLTPPDAPQKPDRRIGTPRAITAEQFSGVLKELQERVRRACNDITPRSSIDEVMPFHNLYTKAVALQELWGVGGRGDLDGTWTFENLFASKDYIIVCDRRVDRYSTQRICPSTAVSQCTRAHYVEHLNAIATWLLETARCSGEFYLGLAKGLRPKAPAYYLYEQVDGSWKPRPLRRKDLAELAQSLGVRDLNAPRHFWFTALMEAGVAQVAIEALLGHHTTGAEPFGYGSGVSVREVCDYLRPILERIQSEVGFEPLIGRGRKDARFQKLPDLEVAAQLKPLPSLFLKRKIDAQELVHRDVVRYSQDPVSTPETLVAHSHLKRLSATYRRGDYVLRYPLGSVLFTLAGEELVLTHAELAALYGAALSDGAWAVAQMTVIEARNDSRPVAQRIVHAETTAAIQVCRDKFGEPPAFEVALKDLHELLRAMDGDWPAPNPQRSLDLILTVAAHWGAVEVAPAAMFAALHKAPFIPAAHLARLHFERSCVTDTKRPEPIRRRIRICDESFEVLTEIVNHWANPDLKLGEDGARRKGCQDALEVRRATVDLDEFEQFLVDLLLADLSEVPPYRRLSAKSLPEYLNGYIRFVHIARREGTLALGPEEFLEAFERMGGDPEHLEVSCHARWHMLHVCAFLGEQAWVPAAFREGKAAKKPCLPRLPVYTSREEIGLVSALARHAFVGLGGTYEFAGTRLEFAREIPLRISEQRYASIADVDPLAGLFHITSTGHGHLKNEASRGSVSIPDRLLDSLTNLRERKAQIDGTRSAKLFCDSQSPKPYEVFDETSEFIRDAMVRVTGCPQFRHHDLRAAAATDLASDVERILLRICEARKPEVRDVSAQDLTRAFARYAWASRLARHASVLTTLRYYVCSGRLELRDQLDRARVTDTLPSAGYIAALLAIDRQTLYARAHRAKANSKESESSFIENSLSLAYSNTRSVLATPRLGEPSAALVASDALERGTAPNDARTIQAAILHLCGVPVENASDTLQVSGDAVRHLTEKVAQRGEELGLALRWRDARSAFVSSKEALGSSPSAKLVAECARWLAKINDAEQLPISTLLSTLSPAGIQLRSGRQFTELRPTCVALSAVGLTPVLRPGAAAPTDEINRLAAASANSGIHVHPKHISAPVFGHLQFLPAETLEGRSTSITKSLARVSARTYGRASHLVMCCLVLAMVKLSKEKPCDS